MKSDVTATQRLFLAIPIPKDVTEEIQNQLKLFSVPIPGRLYAPEDWHITLFFLGNTSQEKMSALLTELRTKPLPQSFEIAIEGLGGGLGAFPNERTARILWMGIQQGHEPLQRLAAAVAKICVSIGFPAEDRPFRPHMTLSRMSSPQDVEELKKKGAQMSSIKMQVKELALYRSLRLEAARAEEGKAKGGEDIRYEILKSTLLPS